MITGNKQRGFTLLEIMVVLVILGILATIVALNVGGEPDKARLVKVKSDFSVLANALDMYRNDNFHFPTTEQGLKALRKKPDQEPEAKNYRQGGYIRSLEKDPWGYDYQYISPGEHGDYDLFSLGADGQPGGVGADADLGNWNAEEEAQQ